MEGLEGIRCTSMVAAFIGAATSREVKSYNLSKTRVSFISTDSTSPPKAYIYTSIRQPKNDFYYKRNIYFRCLSRSLRHIS